MAKELLPSDLFTRSAITQDSTEFLVGRQEIITTVANRLAEDTVSCVVYGMRGVGKTTIAWQVASLLLGSNPLFPRRTHLLYHKQEFDVVFHKCSSSTSSLGELLLDVVLGGVGAQSFAAQFSKAISKQTSSLEVIEEKYGVNLFGAIKGEAKRVNRFVASAEEASKLLSSESKKIRFFFELISAVRSEAAQRRLVFVLDEMERLRSLKGLGEFIKDVDNVQFLFVGIGETVSSIIRDHASAGRKLAGNDFEAPPLSDSEIGEIFRRAVRKADGMLEIDEEFVRQGQRFSGGVPWIAQHVGYQAVLRKQSEANSTRTKVSIAGADFPGALQTVISVHRQDLDVESQVQKLTEWGATEYALLQIVWDHPSGITEDEARKKTDSVYKQFFDKAIQRVESAGIVTRRNQSLYFSDPVLRLFVKFKIDERG